MACKFNLRAENGNTSLLFKDLANVVTDPLEAVNIYYYTKTQEFEDQYNGEVDVNGEPLYSEFSKEKYINDVDYTKVELGKTADAVKAVINQLPNVIEIIDNRIKYLNGAPKKTKYHDKNLQDLKDLSELLTSSPMEVSIPKFLEMAHFHTTGLKKTMDAAKNEKDVSMSKLANIYHTSETYNEANKIRSIIDSSPEVAKLFKGTMLENQQFTDNILSVQNSYINASIDYLTEEFHKRNRTWNRDDIRKQLRTASRDSLYHEQLLEYVGDSQDKVLSMVGSIMMEAENKIRRSSIEFTKKLAASLEALEKAHPDRTSDIFNDVIIEQDNGELHYVDPEAKFTNGKDPLQDKMYQKLQTIKGDKPMMDFLFLFHETITKLGAMLPSNSQLGTRIPSVLKDEFELLQGKSLKERASLLQANMKNKILRTNTSMERGEITDGTGKPVNRIPVFYTQKYNTIDLDNFYNKYYSENITKGMQEVEAQEDALRRAELDATKEFSKHISRDLSHTIQSWHAMATNYAHKNELIHIFDSSTAVLTTGRDYNKVDSGGRQHLKHGTDRAVTDPGTRAITAKRLEKFFEMQLYGQMELDLGFTNVFGAKVDWNSLYRQLGRFTSFNMLALNVLAGIGNFANGEYQNIMESVGGEYYSTKDYTRVTGLYKDNLAGIMEDIGARVPNNFITLMQEHYNLLQSYGHDKIKTSERNKFKRLMKTDLVYFINGIGEHAMQIRGSLAIMNNTKVFNKDGSDAGSLLDAHSAKDGKLVIKDDIYVKDQSGDLIKYDDNQQNRIQGKMNAVMRHLQGNYSQKTAAQMQQDGRTHLVMKFRGWAYEGFQRRWKSKRDNHLLESETEGFYRSGGRVIGGLMKDLSKLNLQLAKENWSELTPNEKANVRRLVTESAMIAATLSAAVILGNAGKMVEEEYGSDSWEDRLVLGSFEMMTYQTNRLYTEIFAFINPLEAVRLIRSPAASMSIVENTIKVLQQLTNPFEEYEAGWRKGEYKMLARMEKLVPGYKQLQTLVLNPDAIKDRGAIYNMD